MRSTARLPLLVMLALCACKPDSGDTAIIDDTDDTWTGIPSLVSISPDDGQTAVSVWSPITLQFDEPLPGALVDNTDIAFVGRYGDTIEGRFSLENDGTALVFTPSLPLEYRGWFSWQMSGFDLPVESDLTTVSGTFETFHNAMTVEWTYRNGAVWDRATHEYDEDHMLSFVDHHDDPGDDDLWGTDDDRDSRWCVVETDDRGNPLTIWSYGETGPDLEWHTADDLIVFVELKKWDEADRLVAELVLDLPGDDDTWFTADDRQAGYGRQRTYDEQGRLILEVITDGVGPDGLWQTEDDRPHHYDSYQRDIEGNLTSDCVFEARGPDGVWFTADDRATTCIDRTFDASGLVTIEEEWRNAAGIDRSQPSQLKERRLYSYDAHGNRLRLAQYISHGPDGLWDTADDVLGQYYEAEMLESDTRREERLYSSPGPDGTWFTSDDPITAASYAVYDAAGRPLRQGQFISAGTDGIWLTDDDLPFSLESVVTYSYEAHGSLLQTTTYQGPGSDGAWGTTDDVIRGYESTTVNSVGNRVRWQSAVGSGPDSTWFTGDDVLDDAEDYETDW